MRFTAELKEQGRIPIPAVIRQGLKLERGDFVEVSVEVIKMAEKGEA